MAGRDVEKVGMLGKGSCLGFCSVRQARFIRLRKKVSRSKKFDVAGRSEILPTNEKF